MKRITLLFALISIYNIAVFGQKKYEMVIEKTDGSEVAINTEDIQRIYFRERNEENPEEANLLGEFQECEADGKLLNDATDAEVHHLKLYKDGTGDYWSITKGVEDPLKYSFTYSYTFSGNTGTMSMTITSSTNPSIIGYTDISEFTYIDGIYHSGEVYYRLIRGTGL